MKLTVSRGDLLPILKKAAAFTPKGKLSNAALGAVRLNAVNGRLSVVAGDGYTFARTSLECEVAEEGAICVEVKAFADRIEAIPPGPIELEVAKDLCLRIAQVGGKRRFLVHGIPAEDYPTLPKSAGAEALEADLPVEKLAALIDGAAYAMGKDAIHPQQHCMHFLRRGDFLQATTTDGHRLARSTVETSGAICNYERLWGYGAVKSLRSLLDGAKLVTIRGDGARSYLEVDDWHVCIPRVESTFPPADHMVTPIVAGRDHAERFKLGSAAFLEVVRKVAIASADSVNLELQGQRLTIENPPRDHLEVGEAHDWLFVDHAGREPHRVTLATTYLVEALQSMPAECELDLCTDLDAVMVRGDNRIAIIMPRRPEFAAAMQGAA